MPSPDATEIEQLEERRRAATVSGDLSSLAALLDDDLVYVHSSGSSDSKASYLESLRTGRVVYDALEMSDRRIIIKPGAALVLYSMQARVRVGGEIRNLNTRILAVWTRAGDEWKLTALHSAAKA
jgi:ketosteroid isomerase-like protein